MISTDVLVTVTILASTAAMACGGKQVGLSTPPANPVVTVRFIGPGGTPYSPDDVFLFRPGVGKEWPMNAWADGTCTDVGAEPLIPGETYDVMADSGGRGGVFAFTTIRFTAPSGPIDLGTFDLRPLGLTMVSPAAGTVVSSYPIDFTWTAYANPMATYRPSICAERLGNGCVPLSSFKGTSYRLTAAEKSEFITGRPADWQMLVEFTTPEGYKVWHQTDTVPFTFPE